MAVRLTLKFISLMKPIMNPRNAVACCKNYTFLSLLDNSRFSCASTCSMAFVLSCHDLLSSRASTVSYSRNPKTRIGCIFAVPASILGSSIYTASAFCDDISVARGTARLLLPKAGEGCCCEEAWLICCGTFIIISRPIELNSFFWWSWLTFEDCA